MKYVILRQNEEYNDESYYLTDGYHIVNDTVYSNKELAEKLCEELNEANFKQLTAEHYDVAYILEDILTEEELERFRDSDLTIGELLTADRFDEVWVTEQSEHSTCFIVFSVDELQEA